MKKETLRDYMSNLELLLNMLVEAKTSEIYSEKIPEIGNQNKTLANQGGIIARNTQKAKAL